MALMLHLTYYTCRGLMDAALRPPTRPAACRHHWTRLGAATFQKLPSRWDWEPGAAAVVHHL